MGDDTDGVREPLRPGFVVGEQVEAVRGVQGNGLDLISLGSVEQRDTLQEKRMLRSKLRLQKC